MKQDSGAAIADAAIGATASGNVPPESMWPFCQRAAFEGFTLRICQDGCKYSQHDRSFEEGKLCCFWHHVAGAKAAKAKVAAAR